MQFGSVEHRKKVAADFCLNEQEVIDMPKREFKTFIMGIEFGKTKAANDVKENFFCVPIDIWNHYEDAFKAILKVAMEEMKQEKEKEDDKEE